jgi:predicted PurR-regulated permease PerM
VLVPAGLAFSNLLIGALVVAALYFTREILVPIALAVLLSFVLSPLVRALQRVNLPRSIAVLGAVSLATAIALSLAAMVMIEVNQLANDLPRYQSTLSEKIHNLRDRIGSVGVLKNASSLLKDLDKELKSPGSGDAQMVKPSLADGPAKAPIPVEVHQPDPAASEALIAMLRPLAGPFTTTGIVVIFLIFFLFQREDLRDRFIRLLGSEDLERTTAALDDAAQRLGKLFLSQLVLNATFGVVIGLGLVVIGVPSAPLWGLLAMVLRFVPYIGAILAAGLPIALAAAVGSDWTMTFWACRRAIGLRAKRRSVSGRRGRGCLVLDLAVGTFGAFALNPAHALFGRLCQACRPSSIHRCDAGRPAGADTSADGIPTHANGRSARCDRTGTVAPEGEDRRGLLRRNPAWRLEIGRG